MAEERRSSRLEHAAAAHAVQKESEVRSVGRTWRMFPLALTLAHSNAARDR